MFDPSPSRRRAARALFVVTLLVCASIGGAAFGQDQAIVAPTPLTQMTGLGLVTTIIGVLAGACTSAVQSGSIFGIKTTPKAAYPYLAAIGAMAIAAGASLATAKQLDPATDTNAVVAALFALFGKGFGASFHRMASPGTFVNGMSPGATSPAAVAAKLGTIAVTMLGLGGLFGTQTGCTAQQGQTALNSVPVDAAFVTCVSGVYAKEPAGTPILTVLEDGVAACGGSLLNVVNALDQSEPRAVHASVAHGSQK
jgi:hypothetical protein